MPFHAVSIPAATSPSLAPVRHPLSINVPERSYSHTTSTDAYTPITPTNENGHIGITRRRHSISSPKSRAASLDYPPRPAKRNSNVWDWRMNGWTKNGEASSYIEPDVTEEEATPVAHPIDLTPPHPPASSSLHPLPKDPNNILPLSVASSPFVSPSISRVPSPHPLPRVDSNAEQIRTVSTAVHPAASSAPGSSSSPRTSVSTSSSRVWPTGRSASRSSAEDDDRGLYGAAAGPSYHPRSWFLRAAGSVSPKISAPIAPRIIRLSSGRLTGTRRWGWIFEWFGMQSGPYGPEVPKRGGLSKRSDRERERLMGQGVRRRGDKKVLGSKWLARITAFIPTEPWSIPNTKLTLSPLTPDHPIWPYKPHTSPLWTADMPQADLDAALEPVSMLIGVFTTDAGVERRHMIRQSYASHWRSRREGTEGVRIKFVMGKPRKRYEKAIQLEMEAFNDILLLDMDENMNSGKTYAFFSWAAENASVPDWEYPSHPRSDSDDFNSDARHGIEAAQGGKLHAPVWRGEKKPQYVVKADEDSFIMLGELERRLRVVPRMRTYWGYLVKNQFMAGECYALSFDLVEYIAASPVLKTLTRGKEDKLVAKWIGMHPQREEIVWSTDRCWIYDHPKAGTVYSHGFLYPSIVEQVRVENRTGLSPLVLAQRGGPGAADAYSTVSKFGTAYRPLSNDMSAAEQVEALVEGSPLSRLREYETSSSNHIVQQASFSSTESIRQKINRLYSSRPTRLERFMGDEEERGGTVVVHFIKKSEWFVETMIAMLGTAEEQSVWHRGIGTGLGALERRKGRVPVLGNELEGFRAEDRVKLEKEDSL
ncbi:conserved hypothetical protein [Cryptococcus gattii WM276]|uniref:Uncharacterized protein n=1 Tax=Cryptococcus gattii serotype B (strain WM276 / ATCC MYA-4071) TaxID=367775 RepID=E6RC11_CRYGW|nr:uncharacterized protein CGB_I2100W [Cryptococcus gattii WM276]ADV24329.1 conserved hypothetical protein [Cryptococcus gattii WM276]